jgi:hypothetical protein
MTYAELRLIQEKLAKAREGCIRKSVLAESGLLVVESACQAEVKGQAGAIRAFLGGEADGKNDRFGLLDKKLAGFFQVLAEASRMAVVCVRRGDFQVAADIVDMVHELPGLILQDIWFWDRTWATFFEPFFLKHPSPEIEARWKPALEQAILAYHEGLKARGIPKPHEDAEEGERQDAAALEKGGGKAGGSIWTKIKKLWK